jgi:hypothetical protein
MTKPVCEKGKRSKNDNLKMSLGTRKTRRILNHKNEPEPPMLKPLYHPTLHDDITYIPFKRSFLYSVAIMDRATRKVLTLRRWKGPPPKKPRPLQGD